MSNQKKQINLGGINGTGKGIVNINSADYKGLQKAILEHSQAQSKEDKIKIELISLKLQIETYLSEKEPAKTIDAGIFLKAYIKALQLKNKQFAQFLEIKEPNLSAILKGKRRINSDLAFKLGQLFDIDPNYWLLIQSKNEILQIAEESKVAYGKKYRLEDLLRKVI